MKELLGKLKKLISSIEMEQQSKFLICAMVLPEESHGKWDFIISAPWLNRSELESFKFIADKLQACLTESELMQISRTVILNPEDEAVKFLQMLETVKNGEYKELRADDLTDKFKFNIKRAYLLRSIS